MKRVTAEDFLKASWCKLGAKAGYEADLPDFSFFESWPPEPEEVAPYCGQSRKAIKWILKTELSISEQMDFSRSVPPASKENAYWNRRDKKHQINAEVSVSDEDVVVTAQLPALREQSGRWEAVYVDRRSEPLGVEEWANTIKILGFNQAVFRRGTGMKLSSRVIAPGRRAERQPKVPPPSVRSLVLDVIVGEAAAYPSPGTHCRKTHSRGEFRCPLREAGQCTPFSDL